MRFAPLAARRSAFVRLFLGTALAVGLAISTIQAQIPGRNVNMVSGSTWPDGDPFLQRQNEPSIAASTRNPLHLLAGANDYRTVDLPGLPGDETGDAWLGLFKSFDGGQRWISTLLPGYPQDTSALGLASPIRGYGAGADPVVRAGTNGLIYYAGLVFDRSPAGTTNPGKSAIFVSRFIDNNNKEAGDPFAYLGTRALVADPGGATGNFLDKPWMAVDIPRDATRCVITTAGEKGPITQNLPAGPVYVAYTLRSTDSKGARYDVYFTRSVDCGNSWTTPLRLNSSSERANQGATMAVDPRNGNVYIAWRQFDLTGDNDAVMAVKYTRSTNKLDPPGFAHKFKGKAKGKGNGLNPEHFYQKGGVNKAIEAAQLSPLDQATSDIASFLAFRTNAYPSLAVDDTGRVYMAWAERGYEPLAPDPATGNARVLVSSSLDGKTWTAPKAVAVEGQAGHQLMPTMAFAGGKLMLVYYDLRETRSEVLLSPYVDDRTALAGPRRLRHTMDLRASMGSPGATPVFAPSVRVSDYLMGTGRTGAFQQLQVNPPNLPMFKQGTAPFMGDYVDVTAAPAFVVNAQGNWSYNSLPDTAPPTFHAAWTDNRDVRPPFEDRNGDGNPWNDYTPPGALGNVASILDPTKLVGQCIPGNAGSRNQNIYTARITGGILVGSPGNAKTLSPNFQRAFVVFVQNTTATTRTFRLTITNQPAGGRASFNQFPLPPYVAGSAPALTAIDTQISTLSTSSRTVYVTSTDPDARISISVAEVAGIAGNLVTGGLGGTVVLNPDIENPDIENPDIENPDIENPDIENAEVYNPDIENPDIENPDIENPDIENPDIENPDIENVSIANPDIENPDIENPDIENPDIENPDIENPDIENPDIENGSLTDVSWSITNNGNTTAAYNVNLFFAQTTIKPTLNTQLILYRTYRTPVVVNCQLKYETRNVLVANVPSPELVKSSTGEVSNPNDPELTNATIWLAPGETARITLRVYDADKSDNVTVTNPDGSTASIDPTLVPNEDVTPVVQQQGVDTEAAQAGETEPPIVVQFPAPQTVPDAASTAPVTPVTVNVLANDSTAFGSTKVISLHPPNMASHSGGGPGDIAYQSSTGFLYTQRGIVDPATDTLVGRLALPPPGNFGVQYQVANQRTGINYGRTGFAGGGLSALDARPGSVTFHQYLAMPAITDSVYSFALDTTSQRMYVIHGPNNFTGTTSISVVDINPANQGTTFHTVRSTTAIPGVTRGQSVAVNPRTQKVYIGATGSAGGVYVLDGSLQPLQPPVKVANTFGSWSVVVNEAANLIFASASTGPSLFALYVIDGVTNLMTQVNTVAPMRFGQAEERLAVHIPSGRVLMRLETTVVIIDGQRGSPSRNTVVGIVGVGRENGSVDIAIDQELGLAVTAGSFDFRADIIDIAAGALANTIPLKAGSNDVAIDPINHRAFVSVPLTYVQEIDLLLRQATAAVPVFIESGGVIVNPVTNKAYSGILAVGGTLGVFSGAGFDGLITADGLRTESRFLFSTRYNATNRFFVVNQGNPGGTSYGPGTVVAINGADDTVEKIVVTRANPFGIAVNQTDGKLYVASLASPGTDGGIDVFDANDLQAPPIAATLGPGPRNSPSTLLSFGRHVVVNPNTGRVYTMLAGGSPTSLAWLDPVTNVISPLDGLATALPNGLPAGIPLPPPGTGAPGPWGRVEVIRVDVALNRIFLAMYDQPTDINRIVALDGNTHDVLGSWVGGRGSQRHTPSYLVVNQGANRLYVTDYGEDDKVTMLDATTLAELAVTPLPEGPSATAFNETANRLYVSSIDSSTKSITALDGATLAILSSVRLPLLAYFLNVDEVESRIYTSGGDSADESGIMVITDVLGQLGTNVSVSAVGSASNGTVVLNDDYSVTYTPNPGFQGGDQFGYTITAPSGTANGTVTINVVPANPVSVAFADGYNTRANQLLTVPAPGPLGNDAAGGPATMVIDTLPTGGVLTPQADGSFTYQPNAAFVGNDVFTYHTLGALGASNTVPVGIVVTATTNLVVTNTADNGAGSLRQAMLVANIEPGSTITFGIPGAGPFTIQPGSALPTMNVPVTIDGYTQGIGPDAAAPNTTAIGTNAVLKIVVRGASAGSTSGFNLRGGNSTIRGLVINGFASGSGVLFDGPLGGNRVEGSFLGTDVTGAAAAANQFGVSSQSPGNFIGTATLAGRNLISGNSSTGARANNSSSSGVVANAGTGTVIVNNLIGTRANGVNALPNGSGGINVTVPNVVIGGTSAAERNVISGNTGTGLNGFASTFTPASPGPLVVLSVPSGLTVQGNFIGTTADGLAALPNTGNGLSTSGAGSIIGGGSGTTPGGACTGACNVISGNGSNGISLNNSFNNTTGQIYSSATASIVEGNYIGVNVNGTAALGNNNQGVQISAPGVFVGGASAATRNVIGGNGVTTNSSGINVGVDRINNNATGTALLINAGTNAVIRGNYVGLNAAGTAALPNSNGISISVPDVRVGGPAAGEGNVVSGNLQSGITTFASTFTAPAPPLPAPPFPTYVVARPDRTIVQGNYVGVSANGSVAVPNANTGIFVSGPNSLVGGTVGTSALSCTGACNLISGNTNPAGFTAGLGISSHFNNTAGAVDPSAVYSSATGTQVLGNYIGVNLTGTAAIPNNNGMYVNAPNVIVGGAAAGARNVVSGNTGGGISVGTSYVTSTNTPVASGTGVIIKGNYAGVSASGGAMLANGQCGICSGAPGVIIGGSGPGEGNLVVAPSGNSAISVSRGTNGAVLINAGGYTIIEGNTVGLNAAGTVRFNAGGSGIYVGSANNQIRGNVVAGNGVLPAFVTGISISGSFATGNVVSGNFVGTNPAGDAGLGNTGTGLSINDASNNTIGGTAAVDRNVISGNGNAGLSIYTSGMAPGVANGNVVLGNYIGVKPDGETALANGYSGVDIFANNGGTISGNTIGGSAAGARNIISGNTNSGINVNSNGSANGAVTSNNVIAGNYIGATATGLPRPNGSVGIFVNQASNNTVGGTNANDGNLIAFNNGPGIAVFGVRNRILRNLIHSNTSLAIDLGWDGATPNDNGDADTGANNRQNFPVLLNAQTTPGLTTAVDTDLSSFAAGQYTVQFFASAACDTNGNSRSERLAGSFDSVSAGGTQTFQLTPPLAPGEYVTATATDALGNTSELSSCFIQADVVPTEVTNTNNSGGGSLRSAIAFANSAPGTQTITFNIAGSGPFTIQPTSQLPVISAPVVIDGYTQPGASPNTLATGGTNAVLSIVINGANAVGSWAGLAVGGGGTTIRGLVINGFTGGAQGVLFDSPSGGDVLSGSFIGTDVTGMTAVPNAWGVVVHSPNSVIGGSSPADRNLLSGNTGAGARVGVSAFGTTVNYMGSGTSVRNNLIGTSATGMAALPNQEGVGVSVPGVIVGGTTAADRNVISGNNLFGVNSYASIFGQTTLTQPTGLIVQGNYIGTSADGLSGLGNTITGVNINGANSVIGGTTGTTPGGACTGACNLVAANSQGISVNHHFDNSTGTVFSSGTGTNISGNYVGVDVTGTNAIPNISNGISATAAVVIGSGTPAGRNVVAGNLQGGVSLGTLFLSSNNLVLGNANASVIRGNYIGLNATGAARLANSQCGICSSVSSATIGGPTAGDGNLVAAGASTTAINLGRHTNGAAVINAGGLSIVDGNTIGLSATGLVRLGLGNGISVSSATNQIRRNVVAGNGTTVPLVFATGINLSGAFATGNVVSGNIIGTNTAGDAGLGNNGSGITLRGASNNTIGGLALTDRNVIVGNAGNGGIEFYAFSGDTMTGNVIQGNYIGVLSNGTTSIPNNTGMRIYANPPSGPNPAGIISGNTIGGSAAGARNIISGNTGDGINLGGAGTTNNAIVGNYIGTTASGLGGLPNSGSGIWLGEVSDTTVGGTNAGEGNLIAFNGARGVVVLSNSVRNRMLGNAIHSNASLGIDLNGDGVTANDGGDGDTGGNDRQNFPALTAASNLPGPFTTVDADLSSFFPGNYTLEFFANSTCDGTNGEGERFVGRFVNVPSGGTSNVVLNELVPAGQFITATATDGSGNTSEFSACATVAATGFEVSGTVRYSATRMQGVTVKLGQGSPLDPPLLSDVTNADGFYAFPGVLPGAYWVRVDGPDPSFISWGANSINVVNADVTRDLTLAKAMALQTPAQNATGVSSQPTLTWTMNPEASWYQVQINRTSDWLQVAFVTSGTNSYAVVTPLTGGENYTWRIDAYDSSDRHVGSTENAFTFTVAAGVTVVGPAGGNGGSPYGPVDCPAGSVVMGLMGRAGDDIDQTSLMCASLPGLIPTVTVFVTGGDGGTNYGATLTCSAGSAVTGVFGEIKAPGYIDRLGVTCTNLSTTVVTNLGPVGLYEDGSGFSLSCLAGQKVVGLEGRQGALMDQISLRCQ